MEKVGRGGRWEWLIPALFLLMVWRAVKRRGEREAAEALARWRAEREEGGKKRSKKGVEPEKGKGGMGKKRKGGRRAAYRKRLVRFLLLTAAQELISRQRSKAAESLGRSRLVKRLSPATEE